MISPSQGFVGKRHTSRMIRRHWLTEDTFLLDMERPAAFRFQAGQRIQLFAGDAARDYSLIPAANGEALSLLVRRVPQGVVSGYLSRMVPGARLHFAGPSGHFIFRSAARAAVLVATGTGVAPFAAMCREGVCSAVLLHGVRREEDLYFRKLFETAAKRYVPCLSGGEASLPKGAFAGRVTRYLRHQLPDGYYDVYLAGRREMIAEAIAVIDDRFPSARVYSEIFY
jgi:ferredoxin-NADP reductase